MMQSCPSSSRSSSMCLYSTTRRAYLRPICLYPAMRAYVLLKGRKMFFRDLLFRM